MNKKTLIIKLCGLGLSAVELNKFTETELFLLYCDKTC